MGLKSSLLVLSLFFLVLCDRDDDSYDCAVVSCYAQSFSIEFIDTDGNNLVQNGTYDLEDIEVTLNGVSKTNRSDLQENKIVFFVSGQEGENSYEIRLSSTEIDTFVLDLTQEVPESDCCPPSFVVNNVTYNNESQEIIRDNLKGTEKIVIVKP